MGGLGITTIFILYNLGTIKTRKDDWKPEMRFRKTQIHENVDKMLQTFGG